MASVIQAERIWWRCDGCGVETTRPAAAGWQLDMYPGGPHHWCTECVVTCGIDVGSQADWDEVWEELTTG